MYFLWLEQVRIEQKLAAPEISHVFLPEGVRGQRETQTRAPSAFCFQDFLRLVL